MSSGGKSAHRSGSRPGARSGSFNKTLTTRWSPPRTAFFRIVAFMGCATMTAPVVLRGPKYAHFIFLYGILWGAAFGSYYAANTALFSTLVPVGASR